MSFGQLQIELGANSLERAYTLVPQTSGELLNRWRRAFGQGLAHYFPCRSSLVDNQALGFKCDCSALPDVTAQRVLKRKKLDEGDAHLVADLEHRVEHRHRFATHPEMHEVCW